MSSVKGIKLDANILGKSWRILKVCTSFSQRPLLFGYMPRPSSRWVHKKTKDPPTMLPHNDALTFLTLLCIFSMSVIFCSVTPLTISLGPVSQCSSCNFCSVLRHNLGTALLLPVYFFIYSPGPMLLPYHITFTYTYSSHWFGFYLIIRHQVSPVPPMPFNCWLHFF